MPVQGGHCRILLRPVFSEEVKKQAVDRLEYLKKIEKIFETRIVKSNYQRLSDPVSSLTFGCF